MRYHIDVTSRRFQPHRCHIDAAGQDLGAKPRAGAGSMGEAGASRGEGEKGRSIGQASRQADCWRRRAFDRRRRAFDRRRRGFDRRTTGRASPEDEMSGMGRRTGQRRTGHRATDEVI
jgi:hypothetical protein